MFRFRPMSSQLRRYIHRALEGNEYVTTASEGEGKWRKVTFRPTEKVAELLNTHKAPADFVPGVIGEDKPEEQTVEVKVDAVIETQTTQNGVTVAETAVVETVQAVPQPAPEKPADEKPQTPAVDCGPLFANTTNNETK